MARVEDRPFPPGDYPVVVVGSGPGGLQLGYALRALGVEHALLSADEGPAGMFGRFPLFQRLISWTKLHAPAERGTRQYERYDWNSLVAEEPEHQALVAEFMDGTSYFPSRGEMEQGIAAFAERTKLEVRYGCRWESTRRSDHGYVLETSDGEYRAKVLVFAVGMTQPWKPDIPGMEMVPHYVDTRPAREYEGKRVVVIGKRNSAFELADGLLPWATRIVLVSPSPVRFSLSSYSVASARVRYLQPFEDHALGGGHFVLDAAIDRVERRADGWRVLARGTTHPGDLVLEADAVIAATGFTAPLGDLPSIGVSVFSEGRLPVQTPSWESPGAPGVYFAGSVTQGFAGLKKYGIPSSSGAVHGFRYNAIVLARHIAQKHLGIRTGRRALQPEDVAPLLLDEATRAPELWNQKSFLARVVSFDRDRGIVDEGIVVLADFVDMADRDGVAIAVEIDDHGDIHPTVYVRRNGRVQEHMLPSNPLLVFDTPEHQAELSALLRGWPE